MELRSVCPLDCPDTCSLTVTVENERIVAIRGSHANPYTDGVLCAKVPAAYPSFVHGDARIRTPLRRVGVRGSSAGSFERISWDEALDEIHERFTAIMAEHGPQAILPLNYGGPHGFLAGGSMDLRFFHRLGASLLDRKPLCGGIRTEAWVGTFGTVPGMRPEHVEHARLIVAWGNNVTWSNLHLMPLINRARKRGAKLVVVDPRRTPIARQADLHIALQPGTDVVLAWAVAAELERRGALDPDFISKSGSGTGQYPVVGFFEGGLDLTDIGLGRECFPTFMVETRSSQSITAVLKDFTIGRFERCAATIRTEIHSAAGDSDPDLQGTSVAPNTTIHDLAIVTGTPGAPAPTGTVTFQLFSSSDCTGVASSQTVALVAGSTDSRSDSGSFTPNPGLLSYQATYNGDSNYPRPLTSLCEPLAVNKFQSSVATHILNASNGSEVTDSLIDLAGAATVAVRDQVIVTKNPAGGDPTPTGTVTVQIFDDGACVHQASLETVTLVGGTCSGSPCGTALSSIVNLDANTLSYRATYSGDGNFLPSTASRCEPVCAIDTTK